MAQTEKIAGQQILGLFEELRHNGTSLRLHLPQKDYTHLTRVLDLRKRRKDIFFLIDFPAGFIETNADTDAWSIDFEFTDKDNVNYFFSTRGGEIIDRNIWIKLPQVVKREQRRKLYRLTAPSGTKLSINLDSNRYELNVIDISLGGSLGVLVGIQHGDQQDPILSYAGIFENVEVVFPPEEENLRVTIKSAKVKRLRENPLTKQHEYALQFLEIDQIQTKILTDLIYRFQREFLRNRLRINL
jgi:c-di-GMP-binding flagellar brake protein YcgR